jgi:predicted ATPase/DNA-binding CsgD family transcriptional regulator
MVGWDEGNGRGRTLLGSQDWVPNNLPRPLTSFVGRERELGQLREAFGETRLLTLTGAGGCGKTRLALQTVADCLGGYSDGAWWVELALLAEPELLGDALAEALGIRPLPGRTALQAACAHLAAHRVVVVLDNCEHLLVAAGQAAEALLRACPRLTVLATSRAPLGLSGETDWRVPSLSLPSDTQSSTLDSVAPSDAVRLFIERARKVRSDVVLTPEIAPSVARICRGLDGIPLAIELAAARMRMMSSEQIAAGLSDRFRLLTGGARDALPRAQTLRASVDWSHDLLDDDERTLFRCLGVFAGGWTLDAVEEVCAGNGLDRAAILDLLGSLVAKSLVVAEEHGPQVRYRLLETVRQYALDRLTEVAEGDGVRDRHRDTYLALAERAAPHLEAAGSGDWLDTLDAEAANFATAGTWAVRTDPESALRLCVSLMHWWRARGRFAEAEIVFGSSLDAAPAGASALRARALWSRCFLALEAGRFGAAGPYAREALDMAEKLGEGATAARALSVLTHVAELYVNPAAACQGFERARALAEAADDARELLMSTQMLGCAYFFQSNHLRASALLEDTIEVAERFSDRGAMTRVTLGHMSSTDGELELAREHLERALQLADGPLYLALADSELGALDVFQGAPERGLERMLPRLERTVAMGAGLGVPNLLLRIALAELATDRLDEAHARCEALISLLKGRDHYTGGWALVLLAEVWRLRGDAAATEATAQRAVEAGEALGNRLLATAARLTLARLAAARGEWAAAEQHAHAHLDVCIEDNHRRDLADLLDALAEVAAGLESQEEAVRLFAAAGRVRADLGMVRWRPEHDHWATLEGSLRERMGQEAFEAAWAQGTELSTDEAIAWIRRARGSRKRPSGGWESITPTELDVVRHVAAGLTNPQIGERMFISPATVKVHIRHVFAKLGTSSRAEVAAAAARHGIGAPAPATPERPRP